jgi:hypothetical protein
MRFDQTIPCCSAASVPGYELLRGDFRGWVPALLEVWQAEEKLSELSKIEDEIRGLASTRAEFAQRLEQSWESYRRRHVERIAKFLSENVTARDPLARGDRLEFLTRACIPFEFFEEALALVPDAVFSEVPTPEREKELSKIRAERELLETRLKELRCPPYLTLNPTTGRLEDLRERFIEHWRKKQGESCEPCTAQGLTVRGAPPDEVWAYEALHIATALNSRSRLGAALR